MPHYLWTARDHTGKIVPQRIEAGSVEESKAILLEWGYTELKLQTNEVYDFYQTAHARDALPAEMELKFQQKCPSTFPKMWWAAIQANWLIYFILLWGLGWVVYRGIHALWMFVLMGLLMAWTSVLGLVTLPLFYYRKAGEARDWHHWEDVLNHVEKLELVGKWSRNRTPVSEISRLRAQALAGRKQIGAALKEFEPFGDEVKMPGWLYATHLAGIYDTARDFDRALEYYRQAIETAPPGSSLWLDRAFLLLFRKRDIESAKSALREAEKHEILEMAEGHLLRLKGLLAYEEGDATTARNHLGTALRKMLAYAQQPLMEGNIRLTQAFLCLVEAKAGHRQAAQAFLDEAVPLLEARGEWELLDRCRQALRQAS